ALLGRRCALTAAHSTGGGIRRRGRHHCARDRAGGGRDQRLQRWLDRTSAGQFADRDRPRPGRRQAVHRDRVRGGAARLGSGVVRGCAGADQGSRRHYRSGGVGARGARHHGARAGGRQGGDAAATDNAVGVPVRLATDPATGLGHWCGSTVCALGLQSPLLPEAGNTMTETHYRSATLKWDGKLAFTGGNEAGGPKITLDGDGVEGPSPVVSLLLAAGACAGSDVVLILEKMKVEIDEFTIELRGRRNEDYPRRFNHIWMTFRLSGRGLTAQNVGRAV